jgi:DNA polymerase-3 subunit epsilon
LTEEASVTAAFGKGRPAQALRDTPVRPPRPHAASAAELEAHAAFIAKLKNPIWSA